MAVTGPIRVPLGAVYVDGLRYEEPTTCCVVINNIPQDNETGVKKDVAVKLQVVCLEGVALDAVTKVWFTPSLNPVRTLVYDQNAGGFQTGYSGTATVKQSPQSGVNDELWLEITRDTDFGSKEIVLVEVEADSSACPVEGYSTSYSFQIEDFSAPELESIFWITPLKARIKFNEPVKQTTTAGGARYVESFYGAVEIIANNQVRIPGASLGSEMIGYYVSIAGSAYPQNNGPQTVTAVNTTAGTVTVSGTPFRLDDGRDVNEADVVIRRRYLRATVSPYKFSARLTDEGSTKSSWHADRIQCAYEAIPVSADAVLAEELPTGEDPDQYIYLNVNQHISFGRLYTLTCDGVQDVVGNAMSAATLDFQTPSFGKPDNRIGMWSPGILSAPTMRRDLEAGGEARKMAVVLQDVFDVLWYESEQVKHLHEPDKCKVNWLPHLLYNQGNPFRFPLETELIKRKLGAALRGLYERIGTYEGIVDMVYDVLGVPITIHPYLEEEAWLLGDDIYGVLGETTILGASTAWARNCYEVHTTATLTDDEFRIIKDVAQWADPPNLHLVRIVDAAQTVDYMNVDLKDFNVEPAGR